jgi:gluconate 2-dehydrogenase subunit 3-like protein
MKIALSRRQFIWAASAGVVAAGLPVLAWRQWQVGEASAASRPRFFTNSADSATLQDLLDRIIPPDTDPNTGLPSPGAKAAAVADYIDFLLGAFLSSAPFIFAGGPFSNRNPVGGEGRVDNMEQPIPLTPLQALAWRIRILGTVGAANATPADAPRIDIVKANNILAGVGDANGDVPGFQQQYSAGIAALRAAAAAKFAKDFPALTTAQQDILIGLADPNFIGLVTGHAAEGMYGNPEYGGNQPPNRKKAATGADGDNRPIGWTIANFEGDRQPLGYTSFDAATQTIIEEPNHPVSTPDPGDPTFLDPKSAAMVRQVVNALRAMKRHPRR